MRYTLLLVFAAIALQASGQQANTRQLQKSPYWIVMINDSTANYFEAVEAFNQYWSVRPKPVEEDEILGEGANHESKEGFLDRMITTKNEKAEQESQQYAFDYKRFLQWQIRVQPWIQPDGSITYPAEQLKISMQGK